MQAAILEFRIPITSDSVGSGSIEMLDSKNLGLALEITFLSCLQGEIEVLPVFRPPSWMSEIRSHRTVLRVASLRMLNAENVGLAVGNYLLSCVLSEIREITLFPVAILDF